MSDDEQEKLEGATDGLPRQYSSIQNDEMELRESWRAAAKYWEAETAGWPAPNAQRIVSGVRQRRLAARRASTFRMAASAAVLLLGVFSAYWLRASLPSSVDPAVSLAHLDVSTEVELLAWNDDFDDELNELNDLFDDCDLVRWNPDPPHDPMRDDIAWLWAECDHLWTL